MQSFLINIASIVVFLMWFTRSYFNMYRLKVPNLRYSKSMASWGFIIPIAWFFIPVQVARDIVSGLKLKLKEYNAEMNILGSTSFLGWWWAFFLIRNVINNVATRFSNRSETASELLDATYFMMFSELFEIIAALITVVMIKRISAAEVLLFDSIHNSAIKPVTTESMVEE